MQERLNSCPKCGSKIIKVVNKTTNQSFYKCSNDKCHFRLNEDHSEMDIDLQGTKLNSLCRGCGYPLEVACGPHGLYARCYQCSYDTTPHNGVKWANTRYYNTKQELKNLIENYKRESVIDYGFDETELQVIKEKQPTHIPEPTVIIKPNPVAVAKFKKSTKIKKTTAMETLLLTMLEHKRKKFTAEELAECAKVDPATARNYLKQLRETGEVKIVGFIENNNAGSLTMLYQTKENPMSNIKTVSEEDGYMSTNKFFKENRELFSASMTSTALIRKVREAGLEMKPLLTSKGVLRGYKVEDLKKLSNVNQDAEIVQQKLPIETPKYNNSNEIRNCIISYLLKNIERGISSEELKEKLGLPINIVRYNLGRLKSLKKIKIVDTEEPNGKAGYHKSLIQVTSSPLPSLKITKDNKRYMSISNFLSKNKKIKMSVQGASEVLKRAGANQIHISIKNKLCKGYSVEDLNKYLLRRELPQSTNPVVLTKEQETNFVKAITNFFKKKEEDDRRTEKILKREKSETITF